MPRALKKRKIVNKSKKSPAKKLTRQPTGNARGRGVFTPQEQVKVIIWIAQFHTPTQVVNLVKKEFNKKISIQNIFETYFRGEKWKDLIASERARYLKEVSEVPIANKRVRLDRLEKIYHEAMTWCVKDITKWGDVEELKLGAAIQAIDKARIEIEGEKSLIEKHDHYYLFDKFKDKSDEELQAEIDALADQIVNARSGIRAEESGA